MPTGKLPPGAPPRTKSIKALLLIDVINDFTFPGGERLRRFALPAARRIATLKTRLTRSGIPTIYVNDNFGEWQMDFRGQVDRCMSDECPGREVTKLLQPRKEDYFVLKPQNSGFYSSSLDALLRFLGTESLILAGFASDICVVYTANDAYMRGFELHVPADCVAAETEALNQQALRHMRERLHARTAIARYCR